MVCEKDALRFLWFFFGFTLFVALFMFSAATYEWSILNGDVFCLTHRDELCGRLMWNVQKYFFYVGGFSLLPALALASLIATWRDWEWVAPFGKGFRLGRCLAHVSVTLSLFGVALFLPPIARLKIGLVCLVLGIVIWANPIGRLKIRFAKNESPIPVAELR